MANKQDERVLQTAFATVAWHEEVRGEFFRYGTITTLEALDCAVYGTSTPLEHDAMLLAALQFQERVTAFIAAAIRIQQDDHKREETQGK